MSTFCGKVQEILDISIDRFNNENINSTVYFLSHCHTDHMIGLEDRQFQDSLNQRPEVFLYTSTISLSILKYKYPQIKDKLRELPINTPMLINFPNDPDRTLAVTTVPAGHCPGSVMLLFESNKTILYTGDYRVQVSDLKKYSAFYSLGQLKTFYKIYLDTTFFSRSYSKLPLRHKSVNIIIETIKQWTMQSKNHIVQILISAKYGSEFLFAEIAKTIGTPIHVQHEVYNTYKCVPELDGCVTLNGSDTQIHASCGNSYNTLCVNNCLVKKIKPSVLWWKDKDLSDDIFAVEKGILKVCYSCHASFEELQDFILFFKPSEVEPCVVPKTLKEEEKLRTELATIINTYKTDVMNIEEDNQKIEDFHGVTTKTRRSRTPETFPEDLDDLLGSPPRHFKSKRLWLSDL